MEECERAAKKLKLGDWVLSGKPLDRLDRLAGCFLTAEGNIKFNLALHSTAEPTKDQTSVCARCVGDDDGGGDSGGGGDGSTTTLAADESVRFAGHYGGVCSDISTSRSRVTAAAPAAPAATAP